MWYWLFIACGEHNHEDVEKQIQALEERLGRAEKELHLLKSAQVRSKREKSLCTQEKKGHYVVERYELKAALESKDLPKVLPYQESSRVMGIRLSSLPAQWTSCGLEDGDIIFSIQDILIRNPKTLKTVYEQQSRAEEIRILLQRATIKEEIVVRILDRKKKPLK